jgi:hypothetical protein
LDRFGLSTGGASHDVALEALATQHFRGGEAGGDDAEARPSPVAPKLAPRRLVGRDRARFLGEPRDGRPGPLGFQAPGDLHLIRRGVRHEDPGVERRELHVGFPRLAGRTADDPPAGLLRQDAPPQRFRLLQQALRLSQRGGRRAHQPFAQPEDRVDDANRPQVEMPGDLHDQISRRPDGGLETLPDLRRRNEAFDHSAPP